MVCAGLVLVGFALGAATLLRDEAKVFDTKGPAREIDAALMPGDVVVDVNAAISSPAPLTPLELYLESDPPVFRPNMPKGDPPFLPLTPVDPPQGVFREAFEQARGSRVHLQVPDVLEVEENPGGRSAPEELRFDRYNLVLPPGATITEEETFPSFIPSKLYTIDVN